MTRPLKHFIICIPPSVVTHTESQRHKTQNAFPLNFRLDVYNLIMSHLWKVFFPLGILYFLYNIKHGLTICLSEQHSPA